MSKFQVVVDWRTYYSVAARTGTRRSGTGGRGRRSRAWGRRRGCLTRGRGRSRALGLLLLLLLLSGGILLVIVVIGDVVFVTTIGSVRVSPIVLSILGSIVCGASCRGGLGGGTSRRAGRLTVAIVATVVASSISSSATAALVTVTTTAATAVTMVSTITALRGVVPVLLISNSDVLNEIFAEFLGTLNLSRIRATIGTSDGFGATKSEWTYATCRYMGSSLS